MLLIELANTDRIGRVVQDDMGHFNAQGWSQQLLLTVLAPGYAFTRVWIAIAWPSKVS